MNSAVEVAVKIKPWEAIRSKIRNAGNVILNAKLRTATDSISRTAKRISDSRTDSRIVQMAHTLTVLDREGFGQSVAANRIREKISALTKQYEEKR